MKFSQLISLTNLDLSYNNLSSVHSSIKSSPIHQMSLYMNSFTSLPDLTGMKLIKSLNLSSNQLGSIPDYILNLTSLITLDLGDNHITGALPPLYQLINLTSLILVNNKITGQVSPKFFDCNLTSIDLGYNLLNGSISWSTTSSISSLLLNNNELTGVIPSVNGWVRLQTLDLNGNNLSSYTSNFVPNSLRYCDMTGNALSCIPPPPCTSDNSDNGVRLCGIVKDVTEDLAKVKFDWIMSTDGDRVI